MNIDQIKQAMKYAEDFEYDDGIITLPDGNFELEDFLSVKWKPINYPLFLQRVIEGINREYYKTRKGYYIVQNEVGIQIFDREGTLANDYGVSPDIDQAKETAIIWVLENEYE